MRKINLVITISLLILSSIVFSSCKIDDVPDQEIEKEVNYLVDTKKDDSQWMNMICRYKCLGNNLKIKNIKIVKKDQQTKESDKDKDSYTKQNVLVEVEGTFDAYKQTFFYNISKENYIGNIPIKFSGLLEFRYYKKSSHWGPCYDLTKWN